MMQNMSLFIPHVFANITKEYIMQIFSRLDIGEVDHIDLVAKMGADGKPYNAAYIHFIEWYENTAARNFQEKIKDAEKPTHLIYDDPWYWIVLENKAQRFIPGDRKKRITLETPVKQEQEHVIMDLTKVPLKGKSYSRATDTRPLNLQEAFEAAGFKEEKNTFEAEMDDLEALMDEEDGHLITIDGRYVEELEKELATARYELMMIKTAWAQRQF
jgi:hypothetical protein